jgi:hypothetical protein
MNYFNKLFSILISSIFLLGMTSLWAPTDNYPDPTPECNSDRTPYSLHTVDPSHNQPVNLGVPDMNVVPKRPSGGSTAVYNYFFNNYFKTGVSTVQTTFPTTNQSLYPHFDFADFRTTHPNLFTTHSGPVIPYADQSLSFPINEPPHEVSIYFIDTQSTERNSLGIIDRSLYPTSTANHPFSNIVTSGQGKNNHQLVFSYTQDAAQYSQTMAGLPSTEKARYELDTYTHPNSGDLITAAHPLLLSDVVELQPFVGFSLQPGLYDFFLLNNTELGSKAANDTLDSSSPTSSKFVWFTDFMRNWGNGLSAVDFQHFQFYPVPQLTYLGLSYLLVAVDDNTNDYGGAGPDKDFNDLFFLVQYGIPTVPEPGVYLLIGTLLTVAFIIARRQRVAE